MMPKFRRLLVIIPTITLILQCSTTAHSLQGEPAGFKNIPCQTPKAEINDLRLTARYDELELYTRSKDPLILGNATVSQTLYAFRKDQFAGAAVLFRNFANFLAIRNRLAAQHGHPLKANIFLEEYIWLGNNMNIILDYNDSTKEGRLFYSCIQQKQ